jgi:hypothetical protein
LCLLLVPVQMGRAVYFLSMWSRFTETDALLWTRAGTNEFIVDCYPNVTVTSEAGMLIKVTSMARARPVQFVPAGMISALERIPSAASRRLALISAIGYGS